MAREQAMVSCEQRDSLQLSKTNTTISGVQTMRVWHQAKRLFVDGKIAQAIWAYRKCNMDAGGCDNLELHGKSEVCAIRRSKKSSKRHDSMEA